MNSLTHRHLLALCGAILLLCAMLFPGFGKGMTARAATGSNAELYDQTDVLEDLEKTTVDGKPFDLKDYAFDAQGKTSVFSFVEFCYSYSPDLIADYGLYVYLHNPRGLKFDFASTRNMISMRAGDDETAPYKKYHLECLDVSTRQDYEGLFFKLKINLSTAQRDDILSAVNSSERQYRVSELELMESGKKDVTLVTVGTSYYYSGYAGYYGPSGRPESTLTPRSEQIDTLTLEKEKGEIGFTAYRPDGSNGKDEFTQDSLHSVYFAVPNTFIETYGEMAAVHATWLNAILKPMLVTGNKDAYDAILPYLGKELTKYGNQDLIYSYYGNCVQETIPAASQTYHYDYGFNTNFLSVTFIQNFGGKTVDPLYLMFYSGDEADSADSYVLPSELILDKIRAATADVGGELVNEKYSKALFSEVDEEFTDINIRREDTYDLTKEVISQNWWERLWGTSHVASSETFDGIPAIEPVTPEKMTGTEAEICDKLYIGEADYEDFRSCYDIYHDTRTIYLFRYQLSDYISQEATLFKHGFLDRIVDTNAYFCEESIDLDFDIIDVTFSNGERETVIPVAMTPVDFIPNGTPPLHVTSDPKKGPGLFEILAGLVLLVGICIAVYCLIKLFVNAGGRSRSSKSKRRR